MPLNLSVNGRARVVEQLWVARWLIATLVLGCSPHSAMAPTRDGDVKSVTLAPRLRQSVELSQAQFEVTMAWLATDARLLDQSNPSHRLLLTSADTRVAGPLGLVHEYERWCVRCKGRHGDCLLLGHTFGAGEKRSLALSIALESGSVWHGASDAVNAMLDPLLLQATVATFMAGYMALLLLPEPISKTVVLALTLYMVSYLGWDTFWSIIRGWRELSAEAERAQTFAELSAAGERFGRIMGANSARIFIMLVTAALGQTAGLAASGPSLPGYAQAALMAETQGFRLTAINQVTAAVVAESGLTVTMATSATVASPSHLPHEPSHPTAREELKISDRQLGKKFGEHRDPHRVGYRSAEEYRALAEDILRDPLSRKTVFPRDAPKYAGETHFQRGHDLLRLSPEGEFRSLYPVD